jgi:hypothetical protein
MNLDDDDSRVTIFSFIVLMILEENRYLV